jgi:hypothetical protein
VKTAATLLFRTTELLGAHVRSVSKLISLPEFAACGGARSCLIYPASPWRFHFALFLLAVGPLGIPLAHQSPPHYTSRRQDRCGVSDSLFGGREIRDPLLSRRTFADGKRQSHHVRTIEELCGLPRQSPSFTQWFSSFPLACGN